MRVRLVTVAVAAAAVPALFVGGVAGNAAAAAQHAAAVHSGPVCPLNNRAQCPPIPRLGSCYVVPGHWAKEINWSGRPWVWIPSHTVCTGPVRW